MAKSIIPENIPNYKDVLAEGHAIAESLTVGKTCFEKTNGMTLMEYRKKRTKEGKLLFLSQSGVATVDEQVEAQKVLYERATSRGADVPSNLLTSNWVNGLPYEYRDKAPKGTSCIMSCTEDYIRLTDAAPMQPLFGDHTCMTPNSVSNVINAIKAGAPSVGTFAQIAWKYPYFTDSVLQCTESVKALSILAAKRSESPDACISSYVGDGIASAFIDHSSELGYSMFEQYIAEELIGVRYRQGLGGLISNIPVKLATWLAFWEGLSVNLKEKDWIVVNFYEGNTLEVSSTDLMSNWGLVLADFLPFAYLEDQLHTGTLYLPKPITEAIRVPTPTESGDVLAACQSCLNKIHEFREYKMIDTTEIMKMKAKMVDTGKRFFDNILRKLPTVGVDINDPIQCLLAIIKLAGTGLEELCYPSERDPSMYRGIKPVATTDLTVQTLDKADKMIETLKEKYDVNILDGKKIIACSADTHEFGLMMLDRVLSAFGAEVVNVGVDTDPEEALDLAQEHDAAFVGVSVHNGQSLAWATRAMEEVEKRNQNVTVLMGGLLNTILEGDSEPVDVTDKVNATGVVVSNDFDVLFSTMSR